MPLVEIGDPGIRFPLIIDGVALSVIPKGMNLTPTPIGDHVDTLDGGSRVFQPRPSFDGVADYSDRYEIEVPYASLQGPNRSKMELIRVSGIVHRVAVFRFVPVIYTCKAGVKRYYLPRYRQNASQLYAGALLAGTVITTGDFPVIASLAGADLDVSYADGPVLADPGAGAIVISKNAEASGEARDYTPVLLGDAPADGDQLVIWFCPAFSMNLDNPRISFGEATSRESHSYLFRER